MISIGLNILRFASRRVGAAFAVLPNIYSITCKRCDKVKCAEGRRPEAPSSAGAYVLLLWAVSGIKFTRYAF